MALNRIFIANRGEIAVRINRAAKSLGLETVQGVSAADRDTMAADLADRTVVLGPAPSKASYLNPRLVVHAAKATGCDGLHPGYGFLSEREELARLCAEEGIAFVGPRPETIASLGDKLAARAIAKAAGVPLVPGTDKIASIEEAEAAAEEIGFPVVMKASAGGGGRGMFVARSNADIRANFEKSSSEAQEAFGDGTLYMERFVTNARHVEVQVLGDGKGKVLHFGERDCSAQRRYQKVVEEAPCAVMPEAVRQKLHAAATDLVRSLTYLNAGTVEFLYDADREDVYFIEVNARIQVEHPVSEEVSGADLVAWQLRIAGGEPLSLEQSDIKITGHAIEMRLNAEDPDNDFAPRPGRISRWAPPEGDGIRIDSHCRDGYLVPPFYDSMVGKLIVHGSTRENAVERLADALDRFELDGLVTNLPLLRFIARHPEFRENRINTRWLEQTLLPSYAAREE